jgi:hypothetical protein
VVSVVAGALVMLAVLGGSLPLFLCMGPTVDNSFFDVCARTILRGGVLYRDIFLHGPPGMVLVQTAIRVLLGWRNEALRLVDFVIVSLSVGLLVGAVLPPSMSLAGKLWTAVVLFVFYLGTSQWSHCQPDVWMLAPALVAFCLRRQQVVALRSHETPQVAIAWRALAEGGCWATACMLKPFAVVPAFFCWLVGLAAIMQARRPGARRLSLDAGCLLAGGLSVCGLTAFWLWSSGNWPYFVEEMFGPWNREYLRSSPRLALRLVTWCQALWPWSLIHFAAVPWSLVVLVGALKHKSASGRSDLSQALLAGMYLGWFLQANVLQRQFDYQLVPPVLLAVTLLAGERQLRGPLATASAAWFVAAYVGWLAHVSFWELQFREQWWQVVPILILVAGEGVIRATVVAGAVIMAGVYFPFYQSTERELWLRCLREGSSPEVRNQLEREDASAPDWVKLEKVADFLRRQGVSDRQLTCYSFAAVPLYVELAVQPASRYVLLWSALAYFPDHREQMAAELAESPQLPRDPRFGNVRGYFPWTEPIVLKVGRYLVHDVRVEEQRGGKRTPLRLW